MIKGHKAVAAAYRAAAKTVRIQDPRSARSDLALAEEQLGVRILDEYDEHKGFHGVPAAVPLSVAKYVLRYSEAPYFCWRPEFAGRP